jgi:hypothetical protein
MRYALKGTDEEWADALKNKEVDGSTVQIRRTEVVKTPSKRKAEDSASILESIMKSDKGASGGGKGKKSKSKKKSRKTIG